MGNHSKPRSTAWTWWRDYREMLATRRAILVYKRQSNPRCICKEISDDDVMLNVTCPLHPQDGISGPYL
jgi:hypothetical protein